MNHTVKVDFSQITGSLKIMHAINNGPTVPRDRYGLYKKLTEAGIPYARLHDTGGAFGGSHYVDIPNVFPDFDADPADPASYDFAFTDALMKLLTDAGVEPFYRLGVTIEGNQSIKPYNIYPPADPEKWARICEGIIRHYNEGWADGFRYGITYWEIWNEPDNEMDVKDNPMWKGTQEEYFELYKVTSRHLKACFPEIKIGGYASCGFYAITNADFSEFSGSTSRVEYFVEFFHNFFRYITAEENRCPMDFFSWHSYGDPKSNQQYAAYARKWLDEYGFADAELIFNEWNPGPNLRGTLRDAANIAAMMCAMQDTPVDMSMYYDGQVSSSYCGLFDPVRHGVFKAYYSFVAWNLLYQNKNAVSADFGGLWGAASSDGEKSALLVVNQESEECIVNMELSGPCEGMRCLMLDQEHDLTEVPFDGKQVILPAYGLCVLTNR